MASIADDSPLGPDLPAADPPPRLGRFVAGSLLALVLVGGLAAILLSVTLAERRASLHATQSARLEALARGRAEVLATWLNGVIQLGRRLTESDLVRLFATEMALSQPGTPLVRSLVEQSPYFQQLISDFARQSGLAGAALVGLDGRTFLSSRDAPPRGDGTRARMLESLARDPGPRLSPARITAAAGAGAGALVLDVLLPVPAAQSLIEDGAGETTAVLVMTVPIAERLAELLGAGSGLGAGERVRLLQREPGGWAELGLPPHPGLAAVGPGLQPDAAGALPYAAVATGAGEAYAVGAPVAGLPWTVLAEVDADLALAPLRGFARLAGALAVILGLALVLAFGAFWWWRSGVHHRELATQYRALADRLATQRQLLQSVTDAMQEMLSLKTAEGRYAFVNPAFARALARPAETILGRSDAELLPAEAAAAMAIGDREALAGSVIAAEERAVELAGRRHHLSIAKRRLEDHAGRVTGVVTVARDQTELVERRRRQAEVIRQTVGAFVRAVELRDPFLVGHTRRVQEYVLAVGRRLGLDEGALATLELAACLSQVGKIFIPDHILAKPGRHSEVESRIMQRHVAHALEVIAPIDFELPVAEAIGQMYERLDGSGYPKGLRGAQIGLCARILGAVDVFGARTAPRSYRDRISPGKALYHLATNPQRYDVKVVAALAEVVAAAENQARSEPAVRVAGLAEVARAPGDHTSAPQPGTFLAQPVTLAEDVHPAATVAA